MVDLNQRLVGGGGRCDASGVSLDGWIYPVRGFVESEIAGRGEGGISVRAA